MCVCERDIFFIHSCVDGLLGHFDVLTMVIIQAGLLKDNIFRPIVNTFLHREWYLFFSFLFLK